MTRLILLTGGTGQLGRELLSRPWSNARIDAPGSGELDLRDADAIADRMRQRDYAGVINAGAYTQVDAAQGDAATAWRINAVAPAALSAACFERGIPIVQISTDYVFDGTGEQPWTPDSPVRPLSVYGASKAGGELAVRASGARHAILRTAWVVSANGRNFVMTMLSLAAEQRHVAVVADQGGSPTAAHDLARAVQAVTMRMLDDPATASGTWHVANSDYATWYEVAAHVFDEAGRLGHPVPRVEAISTRDYPTAAPRPANSRLDTTSLGADFGVRMPPWREAIAQVVRDLLEGNRA